MCKPGFEKTVTVVNGNPNATATISPRDAAHQGSGTWTGPKAAGPR